MCDKLRNDDSVAEAWVHVGAGNWRAITLELKRGLDVCFWGDHELQKVWDPQETIRNEAPGDMTVRAAVTWYPCA